MTALNRRRILRGVAAIAALLLLLTAAAYLIGAWLPARHVASVRAVYAQPAERVFSDLTDVERYPEWRSGMDSVRIVGVGPGDPTFTWIEYSSFGAMTLRRERMEPPYRVTGRIADESSGFGGSWTFELHPTSGGTALTITEHGVVYNPLFRVVAKYVFGHHRSLETYARDLGARYGERVDVVRS